MEKELFLEKETRKIIERRMPKSIRKFYKNGAEINVRIHYESDLKRWCRDHFDPAYDCVLTIRKNGAIINNNLIERASSWDFDKAWNQARIAIQYFLYGDYYWDYEISYEIEMG